MKKELLIGMVGTTLLLGACGNGSTGNSSAEKKDVTFGEIMNKGKKVSFLVKNEDDEEYSSESSDSGTPTKDSIIEEYIFTDDGKQTIYRGNEETTLGDLKDKSDNEILKIAKKENEDLFNDWKETKIESIEYDLNDVSGEIESMNEDGDDQSTPYYKGKQSALNNLKKEKKEVENKKYTQPKERPVKIKVETDGSGNKTANEHFFIQTDYDEDGYKEDSDEIKKIYTQFSLESFPVEIYDDSYGWVGQTSEDGDGENLVTKVGKKVKQVKLDQPDSKYVKEAK